MSSDFKRDLGQALKKIRRTKDISQESLAYDLGGRDQSYISKLESGKLNFTIETLGKILEHLDASFKDVDYFMDKR